MKSKASIKITIDNENNIKEVLNDLSVLNFEHLNTDKNVIFGDILFENKYKISEIKHVIGLTDA